MHYFFQDLTGVTAAALLSVLLIVVPGFAIADGLRRSGVIGDDRRTATCWGLVLGPAVLPPFDALLLRWLGMPSVLLIHMALAGFGARAAMDAARRGPLRWWAAPFACLLAVAWANVDFDWDGRLNQSLTIIDTVKHAAVVAALAQSGLPLHDPFFARPGAAGYYYYFYLGPALIHWIGRPLIDARSAFAAGTFVTLLAFAAVLVLLADAARLIPEGRRGRFFRLILLLCCASGFDLLPGLAIRAATGFTLRQLDTWDEEVRWVLTSILWVPHHIGALIAVFTACLLLAAGSGRWPLRAAAAGAAFATAFGSSVWVALAAAPVLTLWWLVERRSTDVAPAWALPLGGVTALVLSLPQLRDLADGRATGGFPLALYIRSVGPVVAPANNAAQAIAKAALTPGGYFLEFGIFAIGGIVFLVRGGLAASRSTSIGRLLLVAAPVALLLATFVRSTIIYNDFGWRAIWFAQVPALLWTASLLSRPGERRLTSPLWAGALALGLTASLWDMTGLRFMRPPQFNVSDTYVNADPAVDYDLRGAYAWIDRTLPAQAMVQHNPNLPLRALDFGVYSDRGVPVSDVQGRLFGADQHAVAARLALLQPIFTNAMPADQIDRRATAAGASAVLLTASDPLWRSSGGPPPSWTCQYRSARSCVMLLEKVR